MVSAEATSREGLKIIALAMVAVKVEESIGLLDMPAIPNSCPPNGRGRRHKHRAPF
ncbi:MAG: hypothetical protein WCI87_04715 [Euryarchaeota archaeon]